MSDDKKPKEFWVSGINFDECGIQMGATVTAFINNINENQPSGESIHVVEFDAYDALKKENEELKEHYRLCEGLLNKEVAAYNNSQKEIASLRESLKLAVEALESLDQHLCERIIDPCGFDPKKETRQDLITLVIGLSGDNEIKLKEAREVLAKIKAKHGDLK